MPFASPVLFQVTRPQRERHIFSDGDGGVDVEDGAAQRRTPPTPVASVFVDLHLNYLQSFIIKMYHFQSLVHSST